MDAQTIDESQEKLYWYLGDGALLSLFWWGLAQANDPLSSSHLWPSLILTLAGFALALPGLIWFKKSQPADTKNLTHLTFWLSFSTLYPLALLGLFVWEQFSGSYTGGLAVLIHPVMLAINLAASFLIGTILNRFVTHFNRNVSWVVWWLWQFPLILINGSALRLYHFSNLLMLFYLVTVLSFSFWLAWNPAKSL